MVLGGKTFLDATPIPVPTPLPRSQLTVTGSKGNWSSSGESRALLMRAQTAARTRQVDIAPRVAVSGGGAKLPLRRVRRCGPLALDPLRGGRPQGKSLTWQRAA